MTFKVQRTTGDRFEIALTEEPSYIVPLDMAPMAREAFLNEGKWLIISISIWDSNDRFQIKNAIELAKQFSGKFRLGIRAFDYREENEVWIPELQEMTRPVEAELFVHEENNVREVTIEPPSNASPIWVVLNEGKTIHVAFGKKTPSEIAHMVNSIV
jgi:hypothetical protein